VATELVSLQLESADFRLHASFLNGVLHLLVFGVRDLIPNSEQAIYARRIYMLQSLGLSRQTGAVRDTPWCWHPLGYPYFTSNAVQKRTLRLTAKILAETYIVGGVFIENLLKKVSRGGFVGGCTDADTGLNARMRVDQNEAHGPPDLTRS
jgi:hypothetical protein